MKRSWKLPSAFSRKRLVLVEHQLRAVHLRVGVGKPVVPDEGHPLDQLLVGADHAIQPPAVVIAPGVSRVRAVRLFVRSAPGRSAPLRPDGRVRPYTTCCSGCPASASASPGRGPKPARHSSRCAPAVLSGAPSEATGALDGGGGVAGAVGSATAAAASACGRLPLWRRWCLCLRPRLGCRCSALERPFPPSGWPCPPCVASRCPAACARRPARSCLAGRPPARVGAAPGMPGSRSCDVRGALAASPAHPPACH